MLFVCRIRVSPTITTIDVHALLLRRLPQGIFNPAAAGYFVTPGGQQLPMHVAAEMAASGAGGGGGGAGGGDWYPEQQQQQHSSPVPVRWDELGGLVCRKER